MPPKNKPKKNLVDLMLDSGAFSAFRRNEVIDVHSYIEYIKRNEEYLFSCVNLDVLPFGNEKTRTPKMIEDAAAASYKNQQIIKDAGLAPIPVFHQGEKFIWLEKMLDEKEPDIGISTFKAKWNEPASQRKWLDDVFDIITDSRGRPLVKTHGFGITSIHFLVRYPWYTVDSTSWSKAAGYGRIQVPRYVNGKPDYEQTPITVAISGVERYADSSPKWRKSKRGYFESFGPKTQDFIVQFLEEEAGINLTLAKYNSHYRRRALLVYYQKFCNALGRVTYPRSEGVDVVHSELDPVDIPELKFMFATTPMNRAWSELMNDISAHDRLLSYYELRELDDEILHDFVRKGTTGDYQRLIPKQDWENDSYTNFRAIGLHRRGALEVPESGSWHLELNASDTNKNQRLEWAQYKQAESKNAKD